MVTRQSDEVGEGNVVGDGKRVLVGRRRVDAAVADGGMPGDGFGMAVESFLCWAVGVGTFAEGRGGVEGLTVGVASAVAADFGLPVGIDKGLQAARRKMRIDVKMERQVFITGTFLSVSNVATDYA